MSKLEKKVTTNDIQQELSPSTFLRTSVRGGFELYLVNAHIAPHTMDEIGRLRELTFRAEGGGTGKQRDIDQFDTCEKPYNQLVLWDPSQQEIAGGYRLRYCADIQSQKDIKKHLDTGKLFDFSSEFTNNILPSTVELGRSFLGERYQATNKTMDRNDQRKAVFALHSLFDGLGACPTLFDDMNYFFGKFTMYPSYGEESRNALLAFLHTHFPDNKQLVTAKQPLQANIEPYKKLFSGGNKNYKEDSKTLAKYLKSHNQMMVPLVNTYMNLSPTMKTFETTIHKEFGNVEETGILITLKDIYDKKKNIHIDTFKEQKDSPRVLALKENLGLYNQ